MSRQAHACKRAHAHVCELTCVASGLQGFCRHGGYILGEGDKVPELQWCC